MGNSLEVAGKVALITGGNSGIGAAAARRVAELGTTLSFQVSKSSGKATNSAGKANTSETTTSMSLDYVVNYTDSQTNSKPTISTVTFTTPSDLLSAKEIAGSLAGTNLTGAGLRIKSLTLPDESTADLKTYVTSGPSVVAEDSSASKLSFTLTLAKGLPAKSQIVLEVSSKGSDGSTQTVDTSPYTVPDK